MNRKIKLSLITLLGIGSISIASLPLVSCRSSETTVPPTTPGQDLKEITGITLVANPAGLTYEELQVPSIALLTAQKVFNGIDETNYKQFDISMSDTTGQVTMDLTAKEGFVFSDNKNILKSNSFLYPASPTQPKDHSFKTADGINISAKANGTASIIESSATYTGSTDLVIKDSYVSSDDSNRYTITSIGNRAFKDKVLTSLDLSKNTSLTSIGYYSFLGSKLTTLDLTKNTSLTMIGDMAFRSSELTTLLTKNTSLTIIGDHAFYSSKLTTLDLSKNTSLTTIRDRAFSGSYLTTLDLPTSLKIIGHSVFMNSKLTTLDLSKNTSLEIIGTSSFRSSTPTTLVIPDSVTYIGDDAFASTRILNSNLQIPDRLGSPEELARIGITII